MVVDERERENLSKRLYQVTYSRSRDKGRGDIRCSQLIIKKIPRSCKTKGRAAQVSGQTGMQDRRNVVVSGDWLLARDGERGRTKGFISRRGQRGDPLPR